MEIPIVEEAHEIFASDKCKDKGSQEHKGDTQEHDTQESSTQEGTEDIMKIIQTCLKDTKKQSTTQAIKSLSQLIAVSNYVELQAQFWRHKRCKHPCLSASIAIAYCMGKEAYFAHQIRHLKLYLRWHHHLPLPRVFAQHAHHTLLNNEGILYGV